VVKTQRHGPLPQAPGVTSFEAALKVPGTVLGSLLGQGHALSMRVPLLVATAGYLIAIVLAWITIQGGRERHAA
jgi:hypothetical protein